MNLAVDGEKGECWLLHSFPQPSSSFANRKTAMVWGSTALFGAGINSPPCMIEGQFNAPDERQVGNFELCVANQSGKVEHWWRANSSDSLWRKTTTFAHDVKSVASLLEGSYGFNLELIVLRTDNKLQHYWRDGNGWHEGAIIGTA